MSSHRRIVAFNRITADGYFCGPDGNLDWAVPEEALDNAAAGSLDGSDTMVFGRKTYDMFESFWPLVVANGPTSPDPHVAGRFTPTMHALGVWIDESTKIVFSKTRGSVSWKNSQLVRELDPRAIAALKEQPGKDIMLFGSGSILSQLTQHRLIDEYQFIVNPLFLGDGRVPIGGLPGRVELELLEATSYPSGNVKLRYTPRG